MSTVIDADLASASIRGGAGIFYETADLLEIDGQDSFRIRSYRNAAEAIEGLAQQISELRRK